MEKTQTSPLSIKQNEKGEKSKNETFREDENQYKAYSKLTILTNEKNITILYNVYALEKEGIRIYHTKKIMELESKNSDMKRILTEYEGNDSLQWVIFKKEFESNMKDITIALEKLTFNQHKL